MKHIIRIVPILQKSAYILALMFSETSTMAWLGQLAGREIIPCFSCNSPINGRVVSKKSIKTMYFNVLKTTKDWSWLSYLGAWIPSHIGIGTLLHMRFNPLLDNTVRTMSMGFFLFKKSKVNGSNAIFSIFILYLLWHHYFLFAHQLFSLPLSIFHRTDERRRYLPSLSKRWCGVSS